MDIKAITACMKIYANEQMYISEGNIILSGNEEIIKPVVEGDTHQKLTYTFVNHAVKVFAHEQGIIFSKQITGYKDLLLKDYDYILYQIPVGSGKSGAYIKKGLLHNGYFRGQSSDHLLTVCYIASWLIERGIPCMVNHNDGADIIAQFKDGLCAFEYQTGGGNNSFENLNEKRQTCIEKYGRVYFIGNGISVEKMITKFEDISCVIARGQQLKNLLNELCKTNSDDTIRPDTSKYQIYIRSALWKRRSREFREKQNGICASCRKNVGTENLETHHIRYVHNLKRDDNEKNWVALCELCHNIQHPLNETMQKRNRYKEIINP